MHLFKPYAFLSSEVWSARQRGQQYFVFGQGERDREVGLRFGSIREAIFVEELSEYAMVSLSDHLDDFKPESMPQS